jgi:predicted signal transduction protein with EAL and GGDEF domain
MATDSDSDVEITFVSDQPHPGHVHRELAQALARNAELRVALETSATCLETQLASEENASRLIALLEERVVAMRRHSEMVSEKYIEVDRRLRELSARPSSGDGTL